MPNFSYDTFSLDDQEGRALYDKALLGDAKRFWKWRKEHPARSKQGLDKAFKAWWTLVGPLSFEMPRDAARYKAELFGVIERELASNA